FFDQQFVQFRGVGESLGYPGPDIEARAGGVSAKSGPIQSIHKYLALAGEIPSKPVVIPMIGQKHPGKSVLQRRRATDVEHVAGELAGAVSETEPPAGDRPRLGERVDGDGAIESAWQGRWRDLILRTDREMLVDLVRNDQEAELFGHRYYGLHLLSIKDSPRWVCGRTDYYGFERPVGPAGACGADPPQFIDIQR